MKPHTFRKIFFKLFSSDQMSWLGIQLHIKHKFLWPSLLSLTCLQSTHSGFSLFSDFMGFMLSFLLPSSQSVIIDDVSVVKLRTIAVEQNVVVNIPFMLIGLGIILGGVFMFLMCRLKVPEVSVRNEL